MGPEWLSNLNEHCDEYGYTPAGCNDGVTEGDRTPAGCRRGSAVGYCDDIGVSRGQSKPASEACQNACNTCPNEPTNELVAIQPKSCNERFNDRTATGFGTHLLEVCCPPGSSCVAGIPTTCDSACAAAWMKFYLDCSIYATSLSPLYDDFAQRCEDTQWGVGRRARCPDDFMRDQLDLIHASCCPGAPTCTDTNFNAGSPGCKCAVETFNSRCVSHVDYGMQGFPSLSDRLTQVGLSLEGDFYFDPSRPQSGGVLKKVQSDDPQMLQTIHGATCDVTNTAPPDPAQGGHR